jgi:trimeric autotransporter adhesin
VSGITANKVYDGGTSATLNTANANLNGVVGSDNVSLVTTNASASFAKARAHRKRQTCW